MTSVPWRLTGTFWRHWLTRSCNWGFQGDRHRWGIKGRQDLQVMSRHTLLTQTEKHLFMIRDGSCPWTLRIFTKLRASLWVSDVPDCTHTQAHTSIHTHEHTCTRIYTHTPWSGIGQFRKQANVIFVFFPYPACFQCSSPSLSLWLHFYSLSYISKWQIP